MEAGSGHTFFDLGSEWKVIKARQGLDDDDMFTAYKLRFLNEAISSRKPIDFSQDPLAGANKNSMLRREFNYLLKKGYIFDPSEQVMLPPNLS